MYLRVLVHGVAVSVYVCLMVMYGLAYLYVCTSDSLAR